MTKKVTKKKTAKKATKKTVAKKVIKKTTKKVAKKVVKKPAKKVAKKVVKKVPVVEEPKSEEKKVVKKRAGRKKNPKNMYFTMETEEAIIKYNNIESLYEREMIYREKIYKPFCKLAENIFNTFKFSYFDTDPIDVQTDVVSFLTSQIEKFKADKGKAFGYFSIIAKNWLILHNNNTYKRWKQHTEILDEPEEDTYGEILVAPDDSHKKEVKEFMNLMIEYWEENRAKIFTKKRELEIANAVIELFRASDRLEMFNKKALYLYIREISGCKTQHITKVINKMKEYQDEIKQEYLNRGSITTESEFFEDD